MDEDERQKLNRIRERQQWNRENGRMTDPGRRNKRKMEEEEREELNRIRERQLWIREINLGYFNRNDPRPPTPPRGYVPLHQQPSFINEVFGGEPPIPDENDALHRENQNRLVNGYFDINSPRPPTPPRPSTAPRVFHQRIPNDQGAQENSDNDDSASSIIFLGEGPAPMNGGHANERERNLAREQLASNETEVVHQVNQDEPEQMGIQGAHPLVHGRDGQRIQVGYDDGESSSSSVVVLGEVIRRQPTDTELYVDAWVQRHFDDEESNGSNENSHSEHSGHHSDDSNAPRQVKK